MPRLGVFLFIEPSQHYLSYPSCAMSITARKLRLAGLKVVELVGGDANPDRIRSAVSSTDPAVIVGTGHGLECVYTVECTQPLIVMPSGMYDICREELNTDLAVGRVVHLISCRTGADLGRWLVGKGAVAFLGNSEDVLFFIGKPPCTDESLAVFRPELRAVEVLASGGTVGDAVKARRQAYLEEIEYWTVGMGRLSEDAPLIVRLLRVNMDSLTEYGDVYHTVSEPTELPEVEMVYGTAERIFGYITALGLAAAFIHDVSRPRE